MVSAWFMDDSHEDPTLEHHQTPQKFITLPDLYNATGVEYYYFDPKDESQLIAMKNENNYTFEDEITCSKQCMPDLEDKLKIFFKEHLHTDDEIRYVLDGSGYFDVRDNNDKWIRIRVEVGDMLIVPSGIYHRFTLDTKRYIRARRYFLGEPVWTPYNRPADEMQCRTDYIKKLQNKEFS